MGTTILRIIAFIAAIATVVVGALALFSNSALGGPAAMLASITAALCVLYVTLRRRKGTQLNS